MRRGRARQAAKPGELAASSGCTRALSSVPAAGVLARQHLGLLVQPADEVATVVGHQHLDVDGRPRELLGDEGAQLVQPGAGAGRHDDRVLLVARIRSSTSGSAASALLTTMTSRTLAASTSASTARTALIWPSGSGCEPSTTCSSRSASATSSSVERNASTSCGGQLADEADGVGERVEAAVLGLGATHRRVEGGEQLVLDQDAGAGEAVEQRGLAGVGVAGDRDARHLVGLATEAAGVAADLHVLDLAAQLGHPRVDPATVELDLRLTRTTRTHALATSGLATGLPGHRLTPATQARQEVLQLGQLDLRLALLGLRVLGEDVEDQRGPVDDLDLDDVLERAPLAGRQLGVADDGVGALGDDDVPQLDGLARAEVGAGVGLGPALDEAREHGRAGGLGQRGELAHRVVGVLGGALGPDGGEDDALEPQLAVLDLGDVLELGGQPRDTAQRSAVLAVVLVAVVAGPVAGEESVLGRQRGGLQVKDV